MLQHYRIRFHNCLESKNCLQFILYICSSNEWNWEKGFQCSSMFLRGRHTKGNERFLFDSFLNTMCMYLNQRVICMLSHSPCLFIYLCVSLSIWISPKAIGHISIHQKTIRLQNKSEPRNQHHRSYQQAVDKQMRLVEWFDNDCASLVVSSAHYLSRSVCPCFDLLSVLPNSSPS